MLVDLNSAILKIREAQEARAEVSLIPAHVAAILSAAEGWLLIEQLRANEGAMIEICCSNPDFNDQPNEVVVIIDDWTSWKPRRFGADTVLEALRAAKTVRDIETRESDAHGRSLQRCPECGGMTDKHSTECGASWSPDFKGV